jgi:hypothetical protein
MDTSAFVFASDLADEGVETVLDNVEHRAGLGGLLPAFVYHAARDVFPHNPARRVVLADSGTFFFRADPRLYDGGLVQPVLSALARERDVLDETCRQAAARGLAVHAWTVFLHPDRPDEYPSCAPQNAFGDLYEGEFCPANPDVRAYVRQLVADVSRYELATILAESLHYHGLEHGYHHERYFVSLDPVARFLLGLCFCDHCLAAARRAGVNAAAVHEAVRTALDRALADGEPLSEATEPTLDALAGIEGSELHGYLEARTETVATLAAEAAEVAEARGRRLVFLDLAGAVKGYATGRPEGAPTAEISWRFGVDLARIARSCHGIEAIGYAADVGRLRLDLEAYRAAVGDDVQLGVALRPSPPDCEEPANLVEKLALARELGIAQADFYHYGFVRLGALDWVRAAVDAPAPAAGSMG